MVSSYGQVVTPQALEIVMLRAVAYHLHKQCSLTFDSSLEVKF